MKIQTHRDQTRSTIILSGDIDECGAEEVKAAFRDISSSNPQEVQVQMQGVTHIGSAGIGKILVFYKDLAIRGARLSLVQVPPGIAHLLREMKLDTLFTIQEGR